MTVSKVKIEELSTSDLRNKLNEEWERVSNILVRLYPLSNESLNMILKDLVSYYEELKRRKAPLNL
jgi:hypothetical protein